MACGLQCWDKDGRLIFDSTVLTTYIVGYGTTGTGTTGSLPYNPLLVGRENSFWAFMTSYVAPGDWATAYTPIFSLHDGVLSWSYNGSGIFGKITDRQFVYGVY